MGVHDWAPHHSEDFCGGGLLLVLLPGAPERVIFQQAVQRARIASHCTLIHEATLQMWQALAACNGSLIPPRLLPPGIEDRVRATGFPHGMLLYAVETCSATQTAKKFLRSRDYAAAIVGAGRGTFIAQRATRLARSIQHSVPTELYLR